MLRVGSIAIFGEEHTKWLTNTKLPALKANTQVILHILNSLDECSNDSFKKRSWIWQKARRALGRVWREEMEGKYCNYILISKKIKQIVGKDLVSAEDWNLQSWNEWEFIEDFHLELKQEAQSDTVPCLV